MKKLNTYLSKNVLLKNSLFLIIGNGFLALGGFIFWIFVARIYSTFEIGIATSLIAIVSLLSSLALLGFNTGITRFLPTSENKNVLINSTVWLVTLASIVLCIVVLVGIPIFSPPLAFLNQNPYYFILFIVFTIFASLNLLLEATLTALRSANLVLVKNFIQASIKLFLPFLFIGIGGYGIFISFYGGVVLALLFGGILLYKKHHVIYNMRINSGEVKKIATVSIGSYISGLMMTAPLYALPVLITNILGPQQTAFYYIVTTTTNVLNLIPIVIAQNLMVEGSYDIARIEKHLKKAVQISVALLIPSIILIALFGNYILLVFGKQYSVEGLTLLRLLSLSSILFGCNCILSTLLVTFNQVKLLIISNTIYAIFLFGLSFYFIHLGIIGVGFATILSQILLIVFYVISLSKIKKLFLFRSVLSIFTKQ